MRKIFVLLLAPFLLIGASDDWAKVQALKSGSELRIVKRGSRQPITATLYEVNEERIIVLTKSEQSAISKTDIDQLDARPPAVRKGLKPTVQTTARTTEPDYTPQPGKGVPAPGTEYGSTVGFGGAPRPDFETVYRRTAPLPKPAEQQKTAQPESRPAAPPQ